MVRKGKNSLILLSGGVDSTFMLYAYKEQIAEAIYFDYGGECCSEEYKSAVFQCVLLDIPLTRIDIPMYYAPIKDGSLNDENLEVPFRNGIFCSYAAQLMGQRGYDKLLVGFGEGYAEMYSDCSVRFSSTMSNALSVGLGRDIEIITPLGTTKEERLRYLYSNNVSASHLHVCIHDKPCRKCAKCKELDKATEEIIKENEINI